MSEQHKTSEAGFKRKAIYIGAGVLALLVLIVVLQNTASVETRLLFVTVVMPRALLLFFTLVVGFAIGVLTAGALLRRGRKTD